MYISSRTIKPKHSVYRITSINQAYKMKCLIIFVDLFLQHFLQKMVTSFNVYAKTNHIKQLSYSRETARRLLNFKSQTGKFQVKGLRFALKSIDRYRQRNNCATTLLLKFFCQRNFVADFIQLKLSFIQKRKSSLFEPTFGGLRGNVRTSPIGR